MEPSEASTDHGSAGLHEPSPGSKRQRSSSSESITDAQRARCRCICVILVQRALLVWKTPCPVLSRKLMYSQSSIDCEALSTDLGPASLLPILY